VKIRNRRFDKRTARNKTFGQGMAEYIIIVALVAVGGIATWSLVGESIQQAASGVAAGIAGEDGADQITGAQTAAGEASTEAATDRTLSNYNDGN